MTLGSAKVKAYRARQRAGLVVLKVAVLEFETLQALLEAGLLTVGEALDRRRVEHAVGRVVVDWARQWQAINSDRLAPKIVNRNGRLVLRSEHPIPAVIADRFPSVLCRSGGLAEHARDDASSAGPTGGLEFSWALGCPNRARAHSQIFFLLPGALIKSS
jgi:hypothetical protein